MTNQLIIIYSLSLVFIFALQGLHTQTGAMQHIDSLKIRLLLQSKTFQSGYNGLPTRHTLPNNDQLWLCKYNTHFYQNTKPQNYVRLDLPHTAAFQRSHRSLTGHAVQLLTTRVLYRAHGSLHMPIHGHHDNFSSDTASPTVIQSTGYRALNAGSQPQTFARFPARKHSWASYTKPRQVAITAAQNWYKPVSTGTDVETYTPVQKALTETQSYRDAQNTKTLLKYTKSPKIALENDQTRNPKRLQV